MSDNLTDVFLHSKPARLLVHIKRGRGNNYASRLSKEIDCTYSHAVKILKQFRQDDLIEYEKDGRKKLIELTADGKQLARTMERLLDQLE